MGTVPWGALAAGTRWASPAQAEEPHASKIVHATM